MKARKDSPRQHVTWRMALVPLGWLASVSIASSVGKISRSTFRRSASGLTSFHQSISARTDYEALALPGHFFLDRNRGMSELLAEFFRGFFLRLRILPRSMTTSRS